MTTAAQDPRVPKTLLTIDEVAELLGCSTRHVRRLVDGGKMPAPVRIGALLRWRISTGDPLTGLRDWLAAACPSCCETQEVQHG